MERRDMRGATTAHRATRDLALATGICLTFASLGCSRPSSLAVRELTLVDENGAVRARLSCKKVEGNGDGLVVLEFLGRGGDPILVLGAEDTSLESKSMFRMKASDGSNGLWIDVDSDEARLSMHSDPCEALVLEASDGAAHVELSSPGRDGVRIGNYPEGIPPKRGRAAIRLERGGRPLVELPGD